MTKLGSNFAKQLCNKKFMYLSPVNHKMYLLGIYPDTNTHSFVTLHNINEQHIHPNSSSKARKGSNSCLTRAMALLLHDCADGILTLRSLSDCIVDGNIHPQRFLRFQKRSHDELYDLLFSNSLLLQGQQEGKATEVVGTTRNGRRLKKQRKEKQVVMFTDPHTGARLRLYPTMSLW